MRTYRHLFEQFISDESILLAIKNASKGKRKRKTVRPYIEDPEGHLEEIKRYARNFFNDSHHARVINEHGRGKIRTIHVPSFREQIIHHMLVQVIKPIILKGMYDHSYGSIPGRGIHKAKKCVEKWIRKDRKNTKYFLKMDIRHFYASIPHDILKNWIQRTIKDKQLLKIIETIIDVLPEGLPLGFYTSQWLANWYLQRLDHYIKENLHAPHSVRYMDDIVVFASSKRQLHTMRVWIEGYLNNVLGLELKQNWCVARFVYEKRGREYGRDLDFMGFRFYRNRTVLRRAIMLRATRLARNMNGLILNARRFMSYLGWFSHSDTYNVFTKWVKPFVNVRRLKIQISRFELKEKAA